MAGFRCPRAGDTRGFEVFGADVDRGHDRGGIHQSRGHVLGASSPRCCGNVAMLKPDQFYRPSS